MRDAFPSYGWLSEETVDNDERLACERVWSSIRSMAQEFIKGIPEFVVAIALAERGVPMMGVSYNPIKDELFSGIRGAGCFLDGKPVTVSTVSALEHSTILASRSETARGEWKAYEGRVKVRAIGSVAYKLALVAAGQADATFTLTPKSEWDIASGVALIVAAGGRVTDLNGDEMHFNRRDVKTRDSSRRTAICIPKSSGCSRSATPNRQWGIRNYEGRERRFVKPLKGFTLPTM